MVMMDKTKVSDLVAHTDRRLHPVRLAVGHLNRILAASKGGATVTVESDLLESVAATLEIFVEDFETTTRIRDEKKSADSPRVAQTRVG